MVGDWVDAKNGKIDSIFGILLNPTGGMTCFTLSKDYACFIYFNHQSSVLSFTYKGVTSINSPLFLEHPRIFNNRTWGIHAKVL